MIKIKDTFPKLPSNKIIKIYNVTNNKGIKEGEPKINIATKGLFRKQIIILMSTNNLEAIIVQANVHIANINRLLKNIKSNVSTNYVYFNNKETIITTNKVAAFSNLNIVEKYIKELDNVDLNDIISLYLSQSKLHLKILEMSYFLKKY